MNYFQIFPLKSNRKIDFCRWVRVHFYKKMHVVVTEKAALKLARLVSSIKEPFLSEVYEETSLNEVSEMNTVFSFSEEEISIFVDLPKSQQNPNYKSKKDDFSFKN